jgi:hypothetical protein
MSRADEEKAKCELRMYLVISIVRGFRGVMKILCGIYGVDVTRFGC